MESKNKQITLGWPYPKRKKYLEDLAGKSTGITQTEYFQNKYQDFPVHTIPIELSKYRIDNGRTYAAQAQYIAKNELPQDFFSRDPELDQVQLAQHDILEKMTKDKLIAYFKKDEQSQAIILSHEGFVINGNRRLCAWRELYENNKKKYSHFSHIRAIVLPAADPRDIDELEARLQVRPDIKADYTWTARALMLKHRLESYNYNLNDLADLFELSKGAVEEYLDMLSYADAYLENRDKVGEYNLVDKAEYAFRQMHRRRSKFKEKDESRKEVFEKFAFCLIDNVEDGRAYEAIPDLADNLDKVIQNVEEEFDVKDSENLVGIELLGGEGYTSYAGLIDILNNGRNYERIRTIAMDVIEGERLREKERTMHNFVLSQVKKANTALVEAVAGIGHKTEKEGIAAQIGSIESSIQKIKEWLAK